MLFMAHDRDRSTNPEIIAGLRDRASSLQREIDRRIGVEVDLNDRLDAGHRDATESDALFRLLVETVEDYAIFMLDPTGRVATWNAGAQRFKGYTAGEIIGQHFSVFYPASDVAAGKCDRALEVAARIGRFEDEGWRVRKDGSRFWANVVITALRDSTGTLLGFGKVTRDLTERKAAEEQRRADDHRFALLVGSVKDYALLSLDPSGNVTTWNAGAEHIKGYAAPEIIGSHFSRFYPEDDVRAGKCEHELTQAARDGRFEDEGWRVRKDGSRFWANVVISAMRDDLGNLIGYSKVTRDLTERRRAEAEAAARQAAEQASRAKDEFLAMLGHELRNPLAPIISALQLLKLRADTRSAREHQVIERQVKQMIHLVDDLLDVSRISRGKIELKQAALDVRDALAKAAEIAIPLFERKQQAFEVNVPAYPLVVRGDEGRLTQVFANLLNNAGKYTHEGGEIVMTVRHDRAHIVVEVQDNGMGIEPALLPRMFELFVQGYQDADRAEGGLGIGLTLVRSLVQLHGGEVEARSEGPRRGSTFIVRLPASDQPIEGEPEPSGPRPEAPNQRRQILLVDDNEDARMLLAEVLATFGHKVQSAPDGRAALAILEVFKPDVAILDIGLPGMDGYELATRIHDMPEHRNLRLLALTGYGQPQDATQSRAAGFEAHLVKPIDVQRLLAHVASS
jgi:PAS domain S-box-containing protein